MWKECQVLEHQAEAPLLRGQPVERSAIESHGPRVGLLEPGQQPQESALSAAAGTQQAQELALIRGKGDPVDGPDRAEGLGEAGHLKKRHQKPPTPL